MKKTTITLLLGSLLLLGACGTPQKQSASASQSTSQSTNSVDDSSSTNSSTTAKSTAAGSSTSTNSTTSNSETTPSTSIASDLTGSSVASNADAGTTGKQQLDTATKAAQWVLKNEIPDNNGDIYAEAVVDGDLYHVYLYSKSLKEQGGSGSVGTYTVAKDGLYSEGNVLGNRGADYTGR